MNPYNRTRNIQNSIPPSMLPNLTVWVNVVEYFFCLALQLTSLLLLSIIVLCMQLKPNTRLSGGWANTLSSTLIFYLYFLLISLVSALAYHCYMVATFVQNGAGNLDPYWMFWLALGYECANVALPIAILGLTIDRCLSITFPLSYSNRAKQILLLVDIFLSSLLFFSTFCIYLKELPLDMKQLSSNLCLNASCVNTRQRNLYRLGAKCLLGVVNIGASLLFIILLHANTFLAENSTARQKALRNRLVATTLVCETVFNIMPNMFAFFSNILLPIILSNYVGWMTMVGYSLDSFIMSIFYFVILFGRRRQHLIVCKEAAKVAPAVVRHW